LPKLWRLSLDPGIRLCNYKKGSKRYQPPAQTTVRRLRAALKRPHNARTSQTKHTQPITRSHGLPDVLWITRVGLHLADFFLIMVKRKGTCNASHTWVPGVAVPLGMAPTTAPTAPGAGVCGIWHSCACDGYFDGHTLLDWSDEQWCDTLPATNFILMINMLVIFFGVTALASFAVLFRWQRKVLSFMQPGLAAWQCIAGIFGIAAGVGWSVPPSTILSCQLRLLPLLPAAVILGLHWAKLDALCKVRRRNPL
jgi:hypothetical protein